MGGSGSDGSEELQECPLPSPAVLWFVNGCERKPRLKIYIYIFSSTVYHFNIEMEDELADKPNEFSKPK